MITDVDKNSADRSNPSPNTHDVRESVAVMAHGTNSVNYVSGATTLANQQAALNGQFTIVGAIDVTTSIITASGPGAGAFNSSTVRAATVAHGLNYIPGVIAYFGSSTTLFGGFPSLNYNASSAAAGLWFTFQASADATNAYIDCNIMQFGRSGTTTLAPSTVRIYLLQQTAN